MTRTQRALLGVAIGLVALVALGALFFLGTRLAGMTAAASPTPSHAAHRTPGHYRHAPGHVQGL